MWKRIALSIVIIASLTIAASGEEIVTRQGAVIAGKVLSLKGDAFEISTLYGTIKVLRADIVSISFGAQPEKATATPAKKSDQESFEGGEYVNRAASFKLTLPAGWKTSEEVRGRDPNVLAAFVSADKLKFAAVRDEAFQGSMRSYEEILKLSFSKSTEGTELLDNYDIQMDGSSARCILFRAKSEGTPIRYLEGYLVRYGRALRIIGWSIEPLFDRDVQDDFEKIIKSYTVLK